MKPDIHITKRRTGHLYWYEFLRRTNPSTWTPQVREDFGGVLKKTFDEWYGGGAAIALFSHWPKGQKKRFAVRSLTYQYDTLKDIDLTSNLVLVIDVSKPKDELLKAIEKKLDSKQGARSRGRPAFEQDDVKYPFASRPDLDALERTLMAYDLKNENDDWSNLKIAEELQKQFPILRTVKVKKGDAPKEISDKKKLMEDTVARYLRSAETIMEGVRRGIFPKHSR